MEADMNKKARNELIRVIIGLVMIAAGVGLFISKTSVSTELLSFGGVYSWWITVLVILPLAAGIVMLIVKPHLMASKIVAIAGAVVIVVAVHSHAVCLMICWMNMEKNPACRGSICSVQKTSVA